jgi:hypothetical protein
MNITNYELRKKHKIKVTTAQEKLLKLLSPIEAKDFVDSLKKVHYLGTYCVEKDMVELQHSSYVYLLIEAIQAIADQSNTKSI